MGEVYRARDTRLGRDVAIKILPVAFATDEDRLARFQREARVLASLNHPNIGGIYGLEENDGIVALVMELVPGDDLSQRIERGPIPVDDALPIARQVAEVTTDPAVDRSPLWTQDGTRIVFTSQRSGFPELFARLADGTGSEERLFAGAKDLTDLRANGWTADGKELLYTEVSAAASGGAIKQGPMADLAHAKLLVTADSASPVSPRGGWMAYQSLLSGSLEVYAERYPGLGDRKLISVGGGTRPVWSADGRELFFTTGRQMVAVPIEYGPTLTAGRPEVLFDAPLSVSAGNRPYDVTADGHFLMIVGSQTDGGSPASQMVVVQNWTDELKRLVPEH